MNRKQNRIIAEPRAFRRWLKRRICCDGPFKPILAPAMFLVGQLIVLVIGGCRVELTARSGDLPQRLALPEMIAFQLAVAAMAFPTILNLTTIVGSGIFLHLSAQLTGTTPAAECWTIILVTLWMIALRRVADLIRSDNAQAIAQSLLSTAMVGLPLVQYLISDFSDRSVRWFDPISTAIRQSSTDSLATSTAVHLAFCGALIIFSMRRQLLRGRA